VARIQGSISKAAKDIMHGYLTVNVQMLKRMPLGQIKSLYMELRKNLAVLRSQIVDQTDGEAVREKNLSMSRTHAAVRLIKIFGRQKKMAL